MKNKKIALICLLFIAITETFSLLFIYIFNFSKKIRVSKFSNNSYEISFNKKNDTNIFVTLSDKGFDSISFKDISNNQGVITFADEFDGYFTIYNADLDYAIDNRLSPRSEFKFQRLECLDKKTYCYDIKYDDDLKIKIRSIPSIDGSE